MTDTDNGGTDMPAMTATKVEIDVREDTPGKDGHVLYGFAYIGETRIGFASTPLRGYEDPGFLLVFPASHWPTPTADQWNTALDQLGTYAAERGLTVTT